MSVSGLECRGYAGGTGQCDGDTETETQTDNSHIIPPTPFYPGVDRNDFAKAGREIVKRGCEIYTHPSPHTAVTTRPAYVCRPPFA